MTSQRTAPSTDHDTLLNYDQDALNGFSPALIDEFVRLINPRPGQQILELMAGCGNLAARILAVCPEVSLAIMDSSAVQIARAQRDVPGARHIVGDVRSLPIAYHEPSFLKDEIGYRAPDFSPGMYDTIIIKSGMHELPLSEHKNVYKHVHDLLAHRGRFLIFDALFDDADERDEFRQIVYTKDQMAGLDTLAQNRHICTRQEVYSRLEISGFRQIRCVYAFQYAFRFQAWLDAYFPEPHQRNRATHMLEMLPDMSPALQAAYRFQGRDDIVLTIPGEITMATKGC